MFKRVLSYAVVPLVLLVHSPAQEKARKAPVPLKYSTKAFDGVVPPHFAGNDVRRIVIGLQSQNLLERSEFETTTDYKRRIESLARKPIVDDFLKTSTLGVVIPQAFGNNLDYLEGQDDTSPKITYDADKQQMSLTVFPLDTREHSEISNTSKGIIWGGDQFSTKHYLGTNSFGVKVTIRESHAQVYGIAFDVPSPIWHANPYNPDVSNIKISFPLNVDRARILKPRLRLLVVCRISDSDPFLRDYHHHKASLSEPSDTAILYLYVHVVPSDLWVFDSETGEVISKMSDSPLSATSK